MSAGKLFAGELAAAGAILLAMRRPMHRLSPFVAAAAIGVILVATLVFTVDALRRPATVCTERLDQVTGDGWRTCTAGAASTTCQLDGNHHWCVARDGAVVSEAWLAPTAR